MHCQQAVDKQAITLGRGHPAGRGMGAVNKSEIFQIGHHIAYGCGRQIEHFRKRTRPHRLPVGYISFYERFKKRSEEHTSELQSLMRISYAVFCLKKKNT